MKLAVGDVVVYGAHGAGSIAAREVRDVLGKQQTVIVLALAAGLTVELPLELAEKRLRQVADEAEISRVQAVLSAAGTEESGTSWLKRRNEAETKLTSTLGLAEVVRDGTRRGDATGSRLSPSEREFHQRARQLLTNEIAVSRGIEPDQASGWIDAQLSSITPSRGRLQS